MIRFAVFTDLHYDYIPDGEERLDDFIESIKDESLNFIISLGDYCHPMKENKHLIKKLESLNIPLYFAIGNHDSDLYTLEEWCDFVGISQSNQSFIIDKTKFIILNSCYVQGPEEVRSYYKRNINKQVDCYPIIPEFQVLWLKDEMKREDINYVVFSHHSLANEFADRGIKNRREIKEILSSRNTILCMNGHDHGQDCKIIDKIPYYTLNSMSYIWHGLKKLSSYPKDLLETYPLLEDIILYKEELHTIVGLDDTKVHIAGIEGEYKDIKPEDVGISNRIWNGVSIEAGVLEFRNT